VGAAIAIIVMCFLPNAGSLGFTVSQAIIFGLIMLMFLDTSINMAMQPFKMLVGDMVNEKQKGLAYSIQSFLCNAGSVVGYVAPFILAWFLADTAPQGEVPATVTGSFYIGAAILLLCVIYTFAKVKEMPPHEYAEYHGISEEKEEAGKKENMFKLLVKAPKVFWTVGLVQFFCWAAFLYMWTYSTDAIAGHAFEAPAMQKVVGININGKNHDDKYLFDGENPVIEDGKLAIAGVSANGQIIEAQSVVVNGDTLVNDGEIVYKNGVAAIAPDSKCADAGEEININGDIYILDSEATIASRYSQIAPGSVLTLAHIAAKDHNTGKYELEQTKELTVDNLENVSLHYETVLNPATVQYQSAGNWNGVLLAIQAIAAVIWAVVLSRFTNRKLAYSLSLIIGGLGFISVYFIHSQYMLAVSYALMGVAWAAMLAMPFTILTNALSGNHIGTYLGLFNCTICIPQIVAALVGGSILSIFPLSAAGVPQTVFMLMVSGILLIIGSLAVWNIKETFGSQEQA
jgi:MFS family permease